MQCRTALSRCPSHRHCHRRFHRTTTVQVHPQPISRYVHLESHNLSACMLCMYRCLYTCTQFVSIHALYVQMSVHMYTSCQHACFVRTNVCTHVHKLSACMHCMYRCLFTCTLFVYIQMYVYCVCIYTYHDMYIRTYVHVDIFNIRMHVSCDTKHKRK